MILWKWFRNLCWSKILPYLPQDHQDCWVLYSRSICLYVWDFECLLFIPEAFWCATKRKTKLKTAACVHGEDTIKSLLTGSTENIILILHCWKIAASSSGIYTSFKKELYYVLEINHYYNELIFVHHHIFSKRKSEKQQMKGLVIFLISHYLRK